MLHITARMKLLKTEEGGRTSCVRSGYRPNIRFGDLYTDGALTFLDHPQVYPGDTQYRSSRRRASRKGPAHTALWHSLAATGCFFE